MKALAFAVTLCIVSTLSGSSSAQSLQTEGSSDQDLINLKPGVKSPMHPVTLEEIVSLREVSECQISPDGKTVAFILKQGFLKQNDYRSGVFVVATSGSEEPIKLSEEKNISRLQWGPDSNSITFLSNRSGAGQVWRIERKRDAKAEQVTKRETGVSQYEISPDGKMMAFLAPEPEDAVEREKMNAQGILLQESHSFRNLLSKSWGSTSTQLWLYDLAQHTERLSTIASPGFPTFNMPISRIVWAPDSRSIAVEYKASNKPEEFSNQLDIGIVSMSDAKLRPLVSWKGMDYGVCWSPDSKAIAFISGGNIDPIKQFYGLNRISVYILRLNEKEPVGVTHFTGSFGISIWWSKTGDSLIIERNNLSRSALYSVSASDGKQRVITQGTDDFSKISLNATQIVAAGVRQNTITPPEVAIMNLQNGSLINLTKLNPEFENISLNQTSEIRWKNKYGNETNGFLIKPRGYVDGRRYPLLVILYNFSNKFSVQAQWMSSYPAQPFAANGFAVLLMNFPWWESWPYGDFKKAKFWQGDNHLASIEAGVEKVVQIGIADPESKGIMGWSYGSYLTEYTITHSNLFEVASAGEGGLNNPGQYWILPASMRYYLDGLFGGPPYGATYKNYERLSPALNVANMQIPLLREYGPVIGFQSLEFYAAAKRYGKQVEQYIYPDEPHIFSQPVHRIASMQRNLDWFNFWLQGKEDADPAKTEQYKRWRELKKLHEKNAEPSTSPSK